MLDIKTPIGWRKGQTIFNFLEWLAGKKDITALSDVTGSQSFRMADPFNISNDLIDKKFDEFLRLYDDKY